MNTFWRFGHTYLPCFEATVDMYLYPSFFHSLSMYSFSLSLSLLASYSFNHKGSRRQNLVCHGCIAVTLSLLLPRTLVARPKQGHNSFRQPPPPTPKTEGMKHMLPQINHCDQSHGCTANQWSERLWKSSLVPDVPSNDYVVSGAKGNQQTSRNLEQKACQLSTLIKHTPVNQWYYARRAKADIPEV